jgi:hypothetical protein
VDQQKKLLRKSTQILVVIEHIARLAKQNKQTTLDFPIKK